MVLIGKTHRNICPAVFDKSDGQLNVFIQTICGNVLKLTPEQVMSVAQFQEGEVWEEDLWRVMGGEFWSH